MTATFGGPSSLAWLEPSAVWPKTHRRRRRSVARKKSSSSTTKPASRSQSRFLPPPRTSRLPTAQLAQLLSTMPAFHLRSCPIDRDDCVPRSHSQLASRSCDRARIELRCVLRSGSIYARGRRLRVACRTQETSTLPSTVCLCLLRSRLSRFSRTIASSVLAALRQTRSRVHRPSIQLGTPSSTRTTSSSV